MQFIDKILLFLSFLIATILILLFMTSLDKDNINFIMAGVTILGVIIATFEFFRKK